MPTLFWTLACGTWSARRVRRIDWLLATARAGDHWVEYGPRVVTYQLRRFHRRVRAAMWCGAPLTAAAAVGLAAKDYAGQVVRLLRLRAWLVGREVGR